MSVVHISETTPFTLQNIPFGIISRDGEAPRVATAIGEYAFDLGAAAAEGLFQGSLLGAAAVTVFQRDTLNAFMALGKPFWIEARSVIQGLLSVGNSPLEKDSALRERLLLPLDTVKMHLPMTIGDYTDFYSSKEHATNVGIMFRGADNALQPNWLHIPVGYHGRSSSVVVSGTPVTRPHGQLKPKDGPPAFGPSSKLDFELEMAFVVGVGNELGSTIPVEKADEHIFGVVVMNDWSARDIQAWEYVPLGPFLGKNFGTVISPWIVTLEALAPFITKGPIQEPTPLPYLTDPSDGAYDIELKVLLKRSETEPPILLCQSNLKHLYWNFRQQLAHHTVNGCNMRSGDLCGTGTISGKTPDSFGSLLELSWNGQKPIALADGSEMTFLDDGDTIIMNGTCERGGVRLGFGDCVCPITRTTRE